MYFLETIGGLSGETLVSGVIKYLLLNCSEFRKAFVKRLVSVFPPSGIPSFRNGIACTAEETIDAGRLDLLILADNCVLAIENKIWALTQPGQPGKYRDFLSDLAKKRFGDSTAYQIIFIAPHERAEEIAGLIELQQLRNVCYAVWWNDLLVDIDRLRQEAAGSNKAVCEFLYEYVSDQISGHVSLGVSRNQIVGKQVALKNHFQRDLLYRLRSLFYNTGRVASGAHHIGFGFTVSPEDRVDWHWLGFLEQDGACYLELHTGPTFQDASSVANVVDVGRSYSGGRRLRFDIPEILHTLADWKHFLDPLSELLRKATPSATTLEPS